MSIVTGEVDGVSYSRSARNEQQLLIEIETDRAGAWGICENLIAGPYPKNNAKVLHKQQLVIYEHQWPEVQKLVRTDAHAAMLADAMGSAPQSPSLRDVNVSLGQALATAREALALAENKGRGVSQAASAVAGAESDLAREAVRLMSLKPGMRDGLPPLTSARVIKTAPPPPTAQNLATNANHDLAAVLRQLLEEREVKGRKAEQKS
jgi:hypothetical protein